jgi:hypothetical protein
VIEVATWLGVFVVVAALGVAARWAPESAAKSLQRAVDARFAPAVAGALTALFLGWMWGSLTEPASIHDEAAYLLQAKIFASGQLSAPAPPLPEFFEQYHVLVTPRLAPKYPPGHALTLVPGIWLGLPGLMPVLLGGVAGGLLFALARRLAGGWVAALAWTIWLSLPTGNGWRCTYLSESTSAAAWLGTTWLLLRWWEDGRSRDLVLVGLFVAWLGITRPLTAIALAIPVGIVVLVGVWRRKAWGALGGALAAGFVVLSLLPIWNAASTLDWRTTPYTEYSRIYFPYQKLGFGMDPLPALRPLPADMRAYDRSFRPIHAAHTLERLPQTALGRLLATGREVWGVGSWREPLVVFFLLGLLAPSGPAAFGLASTIALFAAYLVYAHPLDWLVYYYEVHAFLAFAVALGLWKTLTRISNAEAAALAAAALVLLALGLGAHDAWPKREAIHRLGAYHRAFASVVAALPDAKAIIFVRYGPRHNVHSALIQNPPDYEHARVWIAYDRGDDNARLLALAPDRVPYLFDEASWSLYRLGPSS